MKYLSAAQPGPIQGRKENHSTHMNHLREKQKTPPRIPLRSQPSSILGFFYPDDSLGFLYNLGFPGCSNGKESISSAEDPGSIPDSGTSPGGGNGNSLQYSCLENSMDRERSLAGYSPWGRKESDTTE